MRANPTKADPGRLFAAERESVLVPMQFSLLAVALHPSGVPHADALGVPAWLQWALLALLLGLIAWTLRDLRRSERGSRAAAPPPPEPDGRLVRTERLLAARAADSRGCAWVHLLVFPSRALTVTVSALMGWYGLDRARAVSDFAGFVGSDGTINAARLAFAFASLFWVAGSIVLFSLRGATVAFGLCGLVGAVLATATHWEQRIEWWGASAALREWPSIEWWSAGAFAMAAITIFAEIAERRDPRAS